MLPPRDDIPSRRYPVVTVSLVARSILSVPAQAGGVAGWAHIGGFVLGAVLPGAFSGGWRRAREGSEVGPSGWQRKIDFGRNLNTY